MKCTLKKKDCNFAHEYPVGLSCAVQGVRYGKPDTILEMKLCPLDNKKDEKKKTKKIKSRNSNKKNH